MTTMVENRKPTAAELFPDASPAELRRIQAALDSVDRERAARERAARERKTLAHRLQAAREDAGLTQGEVARELGVHAKTITRWEHPDGSYGRHPSLADRRRLAEIFKTERDHFAPELLDDDELEELAAAEREAL